LKAVLFICGGIFDLAQKEKDLSLIEQEMEETNFWDDVKKAEGVIKKANLLKSWLYPYREVQSRLKDFVELYPEAEKSEDEGFKEELQKELSLIEEKLQELEVRKIFSHEMDKNSAYLSINAGAGGTEACDWVEMLARMYQKWGAKKGWKVDVVDVLGGDVAGIKNITLQFDGPYAYGYSKAEKGVHRLVRISPFDSTGKRHTSFASVDVTPIIDEDISIEIRPEDIRVDTYRSSGAGGQHVNVTDSAVRITHLPTNIIVSCQKERSQIQNKQTCLSLLRAKLYEKEMMEREKELHKMGGEKKEIAWGSQIRNYVFQPYTLVKDTRTKVETSNIHAVMDGDLDLFVIAYLKEFG
jgi:peptide chain release factor 2